MAPSATVESGGPKAVIISGDSARIGQPFTFDATQSVEGEQPIVGYEWDMGDGTYLFGLSVQHAYRVGGTYTVTLTVTDRSGNKDTTSKDIEISEAGTATPEGENFLVGTSWKLDHAVRNTTVTLVFGASTLSGSAGCNTYIAPYTLTAADETSASISVGPVSNTGNTCAIEVMGQERGYLASLASASVVTVDADSLVMETGDGRLTFTLVEEDQ
jgi:heat shock protein HslJ